MIFDEEITVSGTDPCYLGNRQHGITSLTLRLLAQSQVIFSAWGIGMSAASDVIGFIASALVLATFVMKEMRLLRATAIFSNVAFVVYGGVNGLMPVLALHLLLLPLNIRRLIEAGRPTENSSIHLPRATSKATQMAIEALLL